jgi:C1A family cysteine protease
MEYIRPIKNILLFTLFFLLLGVSSTCTGDLTHVYREPGTGNQEEEIRNLNDDSLSTYEEYRDEPDTYQYSQEDEPISSTRKNWVPGITSLSNLTPEQKKTIASLKKTPINQEILSATPPITVPEDLPESFDWRDNDGDWTTPIKDQGEECGSCWAHAAIGVLEAHWKIINQDPSIVIDLSEQYLISCDSDDDGCEGGDFETAMPYLVNTPGPDGITGTVDEENYPYTEEQEACMDLSKFTRYKTDKWAYVNATAEEDPELSIPSVEELKAAIYLKGPIAVGVQDDDDFDDYTEGIFYSDIQYPETNHAVILVGWGVEDEEEFFIGKNSVGTQWGEDGWFRIDVYSNRIGEGAVYLDRTDT